MIDLKFLFWRCIPIAINDLTGKRFGRLIVESRAEDRVEKNGRHRVAWNCMCDCGNHVVVLSDNLKSGATQSCGCYRKEYVSVHKKTHADSQSKLYGVWCAMKTRCYNKNSSYYERYGGRGISVCDEWRASFESFRDWSFRNGYYDGLTIDRIKNDGNYCPENCRWVGRKAQANNRSSNKLVSYNGATHNIAEWSEITGINVKTLYNRLYAGYTPEKMLSI